MTSTDRDLSCSSSYFTMNQHLHSRQTHWSGQFSIINISIRFTLKPFGISKELEDLDWHLNTLTSKHCPIMASPKATGTTKTAVKSSLLHELCQVRSAEVVF